MLEQTANNNKANPDSIYADNLDEAICSLEFASNSLERVKQKPIYWKWVIIGIHQAVQCCLTFRLSGSSGYGAYQKASVKQWLHWQFNPTDRKEPMLSLEAPRNLLCQINHKQRIGGADCREIYLTDEHQRAFKCLCYTRNRFVHACPNEWHISRNKLPSVISTNLDLIEIILTSTKPGALSDRIQKHVVRELMGNIRVLLTKQPFTSGSVTETL